MERKKFSNTNFNVPTAFNFCFAKFITAAASDKVGAMLLKLTPPPRPRLRWTVVLLSSFLFHLSSAPLVRAVTITVSPGQSIQSAINSANDDDTIYIKSGTYDLGGYSADLNKTIHLVGESKSSTIIKNGGRLKLHKAITTKNITFQNWRKNYLDAVFYLIPTTNEVIDGLVIEDCIFDNVPSAVYSVQAIGLIQNVTIKNNIFKNTNTSYDTIPIGITKGNIGNVFLIGNTFENTYATNPIRKVIAIYLGYNSEHMFGNALIKDNIVNGIHGGNEMSRGAGILAYGEHIQVLNNQISDIDYHSSLPRNCIYLAADETVIDGNILHNCGNAGAGSGSMTQKQGHAVISNNSIVADKKGSGIYIRANAEIFGNHINIPGEGIFAYSDKDLTAYEINNNDVASNIALYVWGNINGTGCGNNFVGEVKITAENFKLFQTCSNTPIPTPSPLPTKPGDLNGDGHVNLADYNILVAGYGTKYTLSDYNQLVANYGT